MTTVKKKHHTLFRQLVQERFDKDEIKVACSYFEIGRQAYWGWDKRGGPPARLRERVKTFLDEHQIALPSGKTLDDLFRKKKVTSKQRQKTTRSASTTKVAERISRRRAVMNSPFADHFRKALRDLGPDVYHQILEMEKPDMALSNAARWAFELGGVPPTQFPSYVRAMFNHGYFNSEGRNPSFSEVLALAESWRLPASGED